MKCNIFIFVVVLLLCKNLQAQVDVQVFKSDYEAVTTNNLLSEEQDSVLKGNEIINQIVQEQKSVSYAVLDYNTGKLIAAHNEHRKQFPASITKVMSLYIAFDKIANGELKLEDNIKVSSKAASQPPSRLGLRSGTSITVKDALIAIIVSSSNDVVYALAEHISGNIPKFIKLMNEKAVVIGMKNTNFSVVTGLPNSNNYSTAYDLSIMARAIMVEHNPYYIMFSIKSFTWSNYLFINSNSLLKYNDIDGIKTGFTNAAGYTLLTSAQSKENTTRVIVSGLGFKTKKSREVFIKILSDYYLPMAEEKRNVNIIALNKPQDLPKSDYYVKSNNEGSVVNISYLMQAISVSSSVSSNHYPVFYNNYTSELVNSESIQITPSQNRVVVIPRRKTTNKKFVANKSKTINLPQKIATSAIKNANYGVQVGAFASYKQAVNSSKQIYNNKYVKSLFSKENLIISKAKNGLYRVRFAHLTKAVAEQGCKNLKNNGIDCYYY